MQQKNAPANSQIACMDKEVFYIVPPQKRILARKFVREHLRCATGSAGSESTCLSQRVHSTHFLRQEEERQDARRETLIASRTASVGFAMHLDARQ
jgi:hypothetical protein